tara:strand:+ start:10289 stop:12157 length:1869 start_codon:yes stop_codon:yes gene_type:complete
MKKLFFTIVMLWGIVSMGQIQAEKTGGQIFDGYTSTILNGLSTKPNGLLVRNSTENTLWYWNGSEYKNLLSGGATFADISGNARDNADLDAELDLKADDDEVVHLAGTETITGGKTFTATYTNFKGITVDGSLSSNLKIRNSDYSSLHLINEADNDTIYFGVSSGNARLAAGADTGILIYTDGTESMHIDSDKTVKITSLEGSGDRMVIANSLGELETQAIPSGVGGDVTAASSFGADNRIIRSDGSGKGVQSSLVTITDSGSIENAQSISFSGVLDAGQAGVMQMYSTGQLQRLDIITNSDKFTIRAYDRPTTGDTFSISSEFEYDYVDERWEIDGEAIATGASTLSEVLSEGNTANSNIIMNSYDITGVGDLEAANTVSSGGLDSGQLLLNPTDVVPTGEEGLLYADDSENRPIYHDGTSYKKFLLEGDAAGSMSDGAVKIAYENNANTNAYTDADKATVGNITASNPYDLDGWQPIIASVSGKIDSDTFGRTSATAIENIYEQDYDDYISDGATAAGTVVFLPDAPPIKVETSATFSLSEKKVYDDQTADAATITLSGLEAGVEFYIYLDRASMPSFSGATEKQIPGTQSFIANTPMVLYGIVRPNKTTFDYSLTELAP